MSKVIKMATFSSCVMGEARLELDMRNIEQPFCVSYGSPREWNEINIKHFKTAQEAQACFFEVMREELDYPMALCFDAMEPEHFLENENMDFVLLNFTVGEQQYRAYCSCPAYGVHDFQILQGGMVTHFADFPALADEIERIIQSDSLSTLYEQGVDPYWIPFALQEQSLDSVEIIAQTEIEDHSLFLVYDAEAKNPYGIFEELDGKIVDHSSYVSEGTASDAWDRRIENLEEAEDMER